jgi:hypothetical protein
VLPTRGGSARATLTATHAADATGGFAARMRAPGLARDTDRRELAGSAWTEQTATPDPATAPPLGPTATWTLSAWDLVIAQWAGGRADPARSMTIDTFGWTVAGSALYAHYYRGTTRIRTVPIGALTGPCGDLRRTVRQFPFARVKAGEWRIFFSATAVLDERTTTGCAAR